MPLISQEEFEKMLEGGEPDLSPYPVFVAPKPTDRGYYRRREMLMRYQQRQAAVIQEAQTLQQAATKADRRMTRVEERVAALEKERDAAASAAQAEGAAFDPARWNEQIEAAQAEGDTLNDEALKAMARANELLAQADGFLADQVDLILPYIRGIKYPQADGTVQVWPRPKDDDDEIAEFEVKARALLQDISEDDWTTMVNAVTGQGQNRVVPTKNSSR